MTVLRATLLFCYLLYFASTTTFAHAQDAKRERIQQSVTTISEKYFSPAEGRDQSFQVTLPPNYSRSEKYPLMVQMFGSASLLPTDRRPFIRIRPSGRGVWGYRSMSRYDILRAIERTQEAYPVDENRVYITGTSAGATGIMHAAAQRPDVFAGLVPLVAFGNDLPLENFRNLPLRCEHGVNDWTSAIGNVRVQFQKLKRLGYDAVLNEHPTAGHGIRVPPPATMDWLFRQRRDPLAKHVVYSCEHPRDGRAYWLKIERFLDPHVVARIEARSEADFVRVTTRNIREFSFDPAAAPKTPTWKLQIDGQAVKVLPDRRSDRLTLVKTDQWRLVEQSKPPAVRVYGAGSAANLFQGEPLLVVYGTQGDDAENQFLQQAATALARSGGPVFKPASVRFPVRADSDLKEVDLGEFNLLLVGSPATNEVLRRIASKLPIRVQNDVLRAGRREPLKLQDSVLSFHYYNPEHPHRAIYVISPFVTERLRKRFLQNPREFLAGSDGFKMIDQPDLLVKDVENRHLVREMQLDSNWEFPDVAGEALRAPDAFRERVHLAVAHMKVMRKAAEVDFAFWWGPEDKGMFGGYDFNWLPSLDPKHYTLADFAVRRRATESMTAAITGKELDEIYARWIATRELVTWPEFHRRDIEPNKKYRIVIPMDMVPKLGNRRRTLSDVAIGPNIMPEQVAREVFRVGR